MKSSLSLSAAVTSLMLAPLLLLAVLTLIFVVLWRLWLLDVTLTVSLGLLWAFRFGARLWLRKIEQEAP